MLVIQKSSKLHQPNYNLCKIRKAQCPSTYVNGEFCNSNDIEKRKTLQDEIC